jgi:hypothetical protein
MELIILMTRLLSLTHTPKKKQMRERDTDIYMLSRPPILVAVRGSRLFVQHA